MKITVHVIYKKDILDPQGQTVKNALINLNFRNLLKVRQGKYFELEINDNIDRSNHWQTCPGLIFTGGDPVAALLDKQKILNSAQWGLGRVNLNSFFAQKEPKIRSF